MKGIQEVRRRVSVADALPPAYLPEQDRTPLARFINCMARVHVGFITFGAAPVVVPEVVDAVVERCELLTSLPSSGWNRLLLGYYVREIPRSGVVRTVASRAWR